MRGQYGHELKDCVAKVGLDLDAVVLDLDNVVHDCCQLSIVDCGHKMLLSVHDTHDLRPEVAIA